MIAKRNSDPAIEYILLALLYKSPKHGYDLHKAISNSKGLSTIWRIKPSKLYFLLNKLTDHGLVTFTQVASQNRPDRKEYQLTDQGKQAFLEWVQLPVDSARHLRLVFHARLFFAIQLNPATALDLIHAQQTECSQWIDSLQSQIDELEQPDFIFEKVFEYRIAQIRATIDWLNQSEEDVLAIEKD